MSTSFAKAYYSILVIVGCGVVRGREGLLVLGVGLGPTLKKSVNYCGVGTSSHV